MIHHNIVRMPTISGVNPRRVQPFHVRSDGPSPPRNRTWRSAPGRFVSASSARRRRVETPATQNLPSIPAAMSFALSSTRALFASCALLAASTTLAAEPKLAPLFNGKDLTNFKAEGADKFWRVENGVLVGENDTAQTGHYLWTQKEYGDFVLEFDVRWKSTTERGVDTGIEMRKPKIQLQLGVSGSLRVDMTGSFYTGGKPAYPEAGQAKNAKQLMKPEGQWNTIRIQAKGNTFTCWINGTKASEYNDAKFSGAAPLGLQIHGKVQMKVEYRNMKIAEL
jgi:hypothetical protein